MCFCFTSNENCGFSSENDYHPKRVVDFTRERDTFRNKIMEFVDDLDEKVTTTTVNHGNRRGFCVRIQLFSCFLLFSSFSSFFVFSLLFFIFIFLLLFLFSFFIFSFFIFLFSFFSFFHFFHFSFLSHFFSFFHFFNFSFFPSVFLHCSFIFPSCSFIFLHFSFMFFMFLHVPSCSFIFLHFLCLCWVLKIFFFGLNFVTISLDSSSVKNHFLGPSRVVKKPF